MMMDIKILYKIVDFGDKYREKYLSNTNKNKVENDWWYALLFFFDRAYYQGRRDAVSKKVHNAALNVLQELSPNRNINFNSFKQNNWIVLENKLKKVIGKGKIGKHADIRMTIEILKYIDKLGNYQRNVSKYSIEKINNGNIRELYFELQKEIFSVGPKISSFYLRDLISIFNLDYKVSVHDLQFIQPIDTWVRQVCYRTGLINDLNEDEKTIRSRIVELCNKNNLSSLKFNQGAWFLGANSFDIILRNIERME